MSAQTPARIVILSGARGVGKSAVCLSTVDRAQKRGYACGGIVTLRRPDDALDVLDVHSGAVRRLSVEESGEGAAVVQGRFHFDGESLAWGNSVLGRALPCHLLVVDELGPLELERGQGWTRRHSTCCTEVTTRWRLSSSGRSWSRRRNADCPPEQRPSSS